MKAKQSGVSKFLNPSREDAKPVTYAEKTCILHLINQTSLLLAAKGDLADRMSMIDGGQEMMDSLCETSEKLLNEVRLTIPDRQRRTINNLSLDSEMRLVPKMTPTVKHVLVDSDAFQQLVDAARAKCRDCADTPEEAKRCKLYQLFLDVLPLDTYEGTYTCPYGRSEWRS